MITNFEKITKKQTLLEELCEQILELTTTEDTENEIIEWQEYSVTLETKIKHARKFVQEIQPSNKSDIDESQYNSLNPETPSFVPSSSHAHQFDRQYGIYLSTTRFIPHNQAIRQISAVEAMTAIDYPNLHFPSSLVKLPSGSPSGTRSSPPCILIHRYVFITKKLSCQLSSSLVSGNNPCFCKFYTDKL